MRFRNAAAGTAGLLAALLAGAVFLLTRTYRSEQRKMGAQRLAEWSGGAFVRKPRFVAWQ
ncbi:MAG: hypothetical protein DIU70_009680 [Bacillota bacterium]|nr:MAG: hypothetical protein DIU70_03655 [Bacillota bacterium]